MHFKLNGYICTQLKRNMLTHLKAAKHATLVIFCKRPKLSYGKQRLALGSDAQTALTIANDLLACAIEDGQHWQGPVVIACADSGDISWANSLNIKADVMAQLPKEKKGNLGDRLNYVDAVLRSLGHEQLIFIGTDAPILNNLHYQSIIEGLALSDIALSQAEDGGVVIMANKCPWPRLTDLPWSTKTLSDALASLCKQKKLTVTYSLPGYDIDYIEDIKRLSLDLTTDPRPARQSLRGTINKLKVAKVASHA